MNYFQNLALLVKSTINVFSFSGYNSLRVFSILISSALIVSFLDLFSIGMVVAVLFGGEELAPFVNYINLFLGSLGLNLSELQILICIITFRLFAGLFCPLVVSILIANIARKLSKKIFLTTLAFDVHTFAKSNAVKQMRLVSGGVNIFCSTYLQALSALSIEIVTLIIFSTALILILPNYILLLLSCLFILILILLIITIKIISNVSEKKKQEDEKKNRVIVDVQSMYREIKSLGVTFWFIEQFDLFNNKVLKYQVSIFGLNIGLKVIIEFLSILFILFIAIIGSKGKSIDPNSSVVFGIVAFLRMYPAINRLSAHSGMISHSVPFVFELNQYIKKAIPVFENEINNKNRPLTKRFKKIIVENFTFYIEKNLIGPFNLEIISGEWVRLKGITGSGKSSLLDALAGFWKPKVTNGEILVYPNLGKPIPIEKVKLVYAYVPQFTHIIEGSVYENMTLGRVINQSKLEFCLNLVCFPDEIKIDRDSVDCRVLSGGEKQRLCIARALTILPDILILDEAFSAIDKMTAKKIIKNIKISFPNLTVLYTFHESLDFD